MGLPEKLQKLRKEANISQKKLAEEIGVSQAAIGYWEKGQRTPSIEAVQKIAEYFCVTTSYLVESDKTAQNSFPKKNILNPGDITLDVTKENFEKYPEYFNAVFMELKKIAFQWGGVDTIDLKTGKRIKNDDFEKKIEELPDSDKFNLMQKIVSKLVVNPILNTLTFYYTADFTEKDE